ncbi:MAG: hypothetical protein IPK07_14940 [Deltaproteobacteria bacterium]|nr:hypothetical protein [Deltaproteobacteria bacterium]
MNQHTLLAVAMVPLIATFSAGCSSPESSRSFSVERLEAPPVGGGLGAGAVAPLTLSPGSGNASGQVVRVRGLSAAARSGLIADDGYLVCDKNNTGKCNTLSRKPIGVSFGIDSAIPYDSSTPLTNLYYADLPYAVDSDAPDRQVVPITFLDRNLSGTEDDILYEQDYRVPVSNVTQVFNYLSNHATEADLAAQDQYFGATAFLPPDYTFAYTTLLSGALAVVNTDTDSGQQPAQVDLAFTRPAGGAVQVFQGTVAGGIGFVARDEDHDPPAQSDCHRRLR